MSIDKKYENTIRDIRFCTKIWSVCEESNHLKTQESKVMFTKKFNKTQANVQINNN